MAISTDRIVIQVTPEQKRHFTRRAKASGLNISEFMRRAAEGFRDDSPKDEELEELLARVDTAGKESIAIIDDTLEFIAASNKRITRIEQRKGR